MPDADDEQVGAFSDALGRAREDAGVQQLIKDPQVKKSRVSLLSRALLSLSPYLSVCTATLTKQESVCRVCPFEGERAESVYMELAHRIEESDVGVYVPRYRWRFAHALCPGHWQVVRVTMEMQRSRNLTPLATALEVLPASAH